MRPKLDFWYEFGSTYSYPTAMRIEALAKELHRNKLPQVHPGLKGLQYPLRR